MSLLGRNLVGASILKDEYSASVRAVLNYNELNNTLGQFYQDMVLKEIPSPETHIAKLREILEGKTQPGT